MKALLRNFLLAAMVLVNNWAIATPLSISFEAASTATTTGIHGIINFNDSRDRGFVEVFGSTNSGARRGYFPFATIEPMYFNFSNCGPSSFMALAAFGYLCFDPGATGSVFSYQSLVSNFDLAKWNRVGLFSNCEEDLLRGGGEFMTICAPAIKVSTMITSFSATAVPEAKSSFLFLAGCFALFVFMKSRRSQFVA